VCGEGQRSCSGSVRDSDALGKITGFSILKSTTGSVELDAAGAGKGSFTFKAKDAHDVSLMLSWDGDLNPSLLSGAGLNCFDLTRQGAYAFIISKASLSSSCRESKVPGGCPAFSMESRVYNASDPTGQKFSSSMVTRSLLDETDLTIPFSNFIRQGPRGKGSFSCAGAVTITLKFRGFSQIDLTTGPIYTNGAEGLTPLPTPTEEPRVTSTATPTSSPTGTPTGTPTLTPELTATHSPIPVADVIGDSSSVQANQPTPVLPTPIEGSDGQPTKISGRAVLPEVVVTPEVVTTVRPSEPQEAVYGEVVAD
jgi:hypothetical protein